MAIAPSLNDKTTRDTLKERARDMFLSGEYQSVAQVAKALGIRRVETVRTWAKTEGWEHKRNKIIDAGIASGSESMVAVVDDANLKAFVEQTVEEALSRHVKVAVEMQEKAMQAIRGLPIRTLADAMSIMEYSIGLERVSRNLAPPGTGKGGTNNDGLTADAILGAYVRLANAKVPVVVIDKGKAEDATPSEQGPGNGAIFAEAEISGAPDTDPN